MVRALGRSEGLTAWCSQRDLHFMMLHKERVGGLWMWCLTHLQPGGCVFSVTHPRALWQLCLWWSRPLNTFLLLLTLSFCSVVFQTTGMNHANPNLCLRLKMMLQVLTADWMRFCQGSCPHVLTTVRSWCVAFGSYLAFLLVFGIRLCTSWLHPTRNSLIDLKSIGQQTHPNNVRSDVCSGNTVPDWFWLGQLMELLTVLSAAMCRICSIKQLGAGFPVVKQASVRLGGSGLPHLASDTSATREKEAGDVRGKAGKYLLHKTGPRFA